MQRQIKACTHCRQHKVKCDAVKCLPNKCNRCARFNLECVVDQHFKPRKGGQVELLRQHLVKMQAQLQDITKKANTNTDSLKSVTPPSVTANSHIEQHDDNFNATEAAHYPPLSSKIDLDNTESIPQSKRVKYEHKSITPDLNGSNHQPDGYSNREENDANVVKKIEASVAERMAAGGRLEPIKGPYILANITLEESLANRLHDYFMKECSPYMPMFESSSAGELYARSEFLFWTVMITAAQAEPTADLYLSFVGPIKELAAKKCLLATTRSSSIVQALLVLCTWPLPSEKMLEDMSSRYASLAYSMGLQLGIHRGKFIYEFSRNQQLMPNAVKWRTRTWVQTYITQHMISASTGIPASMPVDYIIDHALHDEEHPLSPRISALLKIYIFYSKLVSIMGSSISTQDGLMESNSRCPTLDLLKTDLYTLFPPTTKFEDPVIEISFLYARCILDCFAFLPETPMSSQGSFLIDAFQSCTRIVTVVRKLVGSRKIIEFPTFVRNPCSLAALILFRLQLLPNLPEQYVSSARESIVTIHHMYRNLPPSWLNPRVSNDISRIAKLLESLNHVMITHPELLQSKRVMRHMRSHLTFSMFYELLYIIHEAKRRNAKKAGAASITVAAEQIAKDIASSTGQPLQAGSQKVTSNAPSGFEDSSPETNIDSTHEGGTLSSLIHSGSTVPHRDLNPLPLFNNISRDSFVSSTVISPNGTTMTTLTRTNDNSRSGTNHPYNMDVNGFYEPNINPLPQGSEDHGQEQTHLSDKISQNTGIAMSDTDSRHFSGQYYQQNDNSSYRKSSNGQIYHQHNSGSGLENDPGDMGSDMNGLFMGLDWMNTEGDDFLGWMMPRNE